MNNVIVYVTAAGYNEAIINNEAALYYLTLSDLYESEGIVPHIELEVTEWEDTPNNTIDLSNINYN